MHGSGAVVIGGDYRGLGAVRSLGRHGIPVWVLVSQHRLAAFSRFAVRSLPWPSGDGERLECLLRLAEKQRLSGWTLFPTADESVAFIARNFDVLGERFVLTTPPWPILRWAHDKRLTYRLAAELGLPYPRTHHPARPEDLDAFDGGYPVLVKPAVREGFNRLTHEKAWVAAGREELRARYADALGLVPPDVIMIQEMIPGGGTDQYSFAGLFRDGEALTCLVARRARQYPATIGRSSSYVETVDEADVEKLGRTILSRILLTGLAEVEFKRDPRDGAFKVLDINPRVWGWHTLGRAVGVDFTYLLWRLVHGLSVPEQRVPAGLRWARGLTDFATAAAEIAGGRLPVGPYLRSLRPPLERAIFAADDPLPALVELPLLAVLAARRGAF
jgi:predicted ATP-grasp superfamily ATP-dependent carboligase